MMRLGRRLSTGVVLLYVLSFVVWRLLVASPLYERWWPLQVSEVFRAWSVAPLPVLLLLGIVGRSRWLWTGLLIPFIWFGSEYGGLFLPATPALAIAKAEGSTLRVMTFNTWNQVDEEGAFAAAVERWQPDLVALQEVKFAFRKDLKEAEEVWPYQVHAPIRGRYNISILSKVPITIERVDDERFGCHCVQALLEWNGETIRVIVVHIRAPDTSVKFRRGIPVVRRFDASNQALSYAALAKQIEESDEPLIVLGDFNTTEGQPGYRLLYQLGLEDAHEAAGWGLGFTYPAPRTRVSWLPIPLIRIDHVFFNEAWQATEAWTTPLMGSDHQALVADLRWVGRE
jgi:vancomycin resistance protein VanJ